MIVLFDLFFYFLHLISYRILLGSLFHENRLQNEREQGIRSDATQGLDHLYLSWLETQNPSFKALRVLLDSVRIHAIYRPLGVKVH